MGGMTSSNTSATTKTCKRSSRKRKEISSQSSFTSRKTKIGGEPSEMNSINEMSVSLISNLSLSTGSEVARWLQRPSPRPATNSNSNTTTPSLSTPTLPANATSCPPSGNR